MMIFAVFIAVAIVADDSPPASKADLDSARIAYKKKAATVARDSESQVNLALWCELRGLGVEKIKHLTIALSLDPTNTRAHGLLRHVRDADKWIPFERARDEIMSNRDLVEKLVEYHRRRYRLVQSAALERKKIRAMIDDGLEIEARAYRIRCDHNLAPEHVKLGGWCEKNGLKLEAIAHFTTAIHLDPARETSWKRLGYVKHDNKWMTKQQIDAAKEDERIQFKADRYWESTLRKLSNQLGDKRRRGEAERLLADVADPRAVASIHKVFSDSHPSVQRRRVQLLSQIPNRASTLALAKIALSTDDDATRSLAIAALSRREPREFGKLLVDLFHTPIHYAFEPVNGPGSTGGLIIDTPRFHLTRTYDAPPAFRLGSTFQGYIGYDGNGMPVVATSNDLNQLWNDTTSPYLMRSPLQDIAFLEQRTAQLLAAANLKAQVARQRLVADINDIEQANAKTRSLDEHILTVLMGSLGAPDVKEDEDALQIWYYDKIGYRYQPSPKITVADALPQIPAPEITCCFAARTPIHTIDGVAPIETIQVGDRVLSMNPADGTLRFMPVTIIHHNPPYKIMRITLSNRDVLATIGYHRVWRAGRGWAQARELERGDRLRTLDGVVTVVAIEKGEEAPVFNLDVAEDHTYFVGEKATLVHDNTLPPIIPPRPFDFTE